MKNNIVNQLAGWYAFRHFFSGVADSPSENFDFDVAISDLENDFLPEDAAEWNIWEPFENTELSDLAELVASQKDSYLMFLDNVLQNSAYFAADGNYGSALGLMFANTENWSEEDWTEVEETSDHVRTETVQQIINKHDTV